MTELRLAEVLIRGKTELRALGTPWALIGGLAVSAWAEPRTTRDIDIAVAMEDDGEAGDEQQGEGPGRPHLDGILPLASQRYRQPR